MTRRACARLGRLGRVSQMGRLSLWLAGAIDIHVICSQGCAAATVQRILRHSSISVTTGTYVEVIEAVQRDALNSMGTLFEHVGDESSGRLSSKKSRLSSRLSSTARKAGP